MKQFYDLYAKNEKVSPLVTQLSWTNHLLIMSGYISDEEREFYIRLAIKERYTKRQLERQMDSGYYERYMLSVVEYAMSRTMSPMMVSQYQLQLPDKEVLRKKLQEFANIP